jgi:hypothetical protein
MENEAAFLMSIYPKVEMTLVQKLLEKYDTFEEVNEALMAFYTDVEEQ